MKNKYLHVSSILVIVILLTSCTPLVRFSSKENIKKNKISATEKKAGSNEEQNHAGETERGFASYYADSFIGRMTSNGEFYNPNEFTAAHLSLPFGTKVQVTNLKNHKTVVVRINDRGPYVDGRIIDLSRAAAESLEMLSDGIAEVELKVLE